MSSFFVFSIKTTLHFFLFGSTFSLHHLIRCTLITSITSDPWSSPSASCLFFSSISRSPFSPRSYRVFWTFTPRQSQSIPIWKYVNQIKNNSINLTDLGTTHLEVAQKRAVACDFQTTERNKYTVLAVDYYTVENTCRVTLQWELFFSNSTQSNVIWSHVYCFKVIELPEARLNPPKLFNLLTSLLLINVLACTDTLALYFASKFSMVSLMDVMVDPLSVITHDLSKRKLEGERSFCGLTLTSSKTCHHGAKNPRIHRWLGNNCCY